MGLQSLFLGLRSRRDDSGVETWVRARGMNQFKVVPQPSPNVLGLHVSADLLDDVDDRDAVTGHELPMAFRAFASGGFLL